MPGDDGAGADSAHGQRGSLEVPQALEQGLVRGAVIHGQIQVDGWDAQSRHETGAVGVQHTAVVQIGAVRTPRPRGNVRIRLEHGPDGQRLVVRMSLRDLRSGIGIRIVHFGGVVGHDLGLVVLRHPAGRRRVGEGQHADQGEQCGNKRETG